VNSCSTDSSPSTTDRGAPYPLCGLVASARQAVVSVVENVRLARDTYRLRIAAPELARDIVPGQFVMIRAPGTTNPLLGRPFALYDTYLDAAGSPAGIDVVYLVVGKLTSLMSGWQPGDLVEVWGPLGNGFPAPAAGRLLFVAGGIGNTPFLATAREALGRRKYGARCVPAGTRQITFCYGVRSADYLAGLPDFDALGIETQIATDDGTRGHHGFVTQVLQAHLARQGDPAAIYACGPEPMLRATAKIAADHKILCWLSLETPMACGFGACFSCVTRVKLPAGGWDYRRVCVEGPIFDASTLALD
jgi:dihydroorotate dehydrogenase electron transfer subunit